MRKPRLNINEFVLNLVAFNQIDDPEAFLPALTISNLEIVLPVSKYEIEGALYNVETDQYIKKSINKESLVEYSLTDKGREKCKNIKQYGHLNFRPQIELILSASSNDVPIDQIYFLAEFYENWAGNVVHVLADEFAHGDKLHDNLYICFLTAQTSIFDWLTDTLYSAQYEIVFRELRSILEGLFLTYSIDSAHPNLTFDQKLIEWKQLEENYKSYGKKVFKNSALEDWEDYYKLYKKLSGYVHASTKIMGNKMVGLHGIDSLEPEFQKDMFINCVSTWKEVAFLACNMASDLLSEYSIQFYISPKVFDHVDYSNVDFEF